MKDRIRMIRKNKGLTMSEFAKTLGASPSSVQKWEYGLQNPSEQVLRLICQQYNVNRHWLDTGEGEPYLPSLEPENLMELVDEKLPEASLFVKATVKMLLQRSDDDLLAIEKALEDLVSIYEDMKKEDG